MLITEEYLTQNKLLHAEGHYGVNGAKWATEVLQALAAVKGTSVLDYGAGQQTLRAHLPGIDIRCYDPAVPEIAARPIPADLVVCTDVLEHVEPECIDAVLDDIARCTGKAVFLVIATFAAKKTLPDGRNAHLIQENGEWWIPKLMSRWNWKQFINWKDRDIIFVGRKK